MRDMANLNLKQSITSENDRNLIDLVESEKKHNSVMEDICFAKAR